MKLTQVATAVKAQLFAYLPQKLVGGSPTKDNVTTTSAVLEQEQAVDLLVRMLTRLPEVDEVLKQAGIRREKLRVLLGDDEIQQACETRLDSLAATPFRLEPSEGKPAEQLTAIIKKVHNSAVSSIFMARLFGYSVMEAVYERHEEGYMGLKFLGEKPMEWFEPKSDGTLVFYPNDGSVNPYGIAVDQKFKFFCTVSRPTYRNPYGEALLSRLYWPWFYRHNGWRFWGKFLERFGSPLLVGKSQDPKAMVAALLQAHSNAVVGVGREDGVEAVGVASGNNGQAFDLFEAAVVRRVQKVVLGQTLTSGTDGGSGNRALGQVHDAVRTDKRNSDLKMVTETMQRVVNALCELNGWPKHEIVFADEQGLEPERAARDTQLWSQGVRFTEEYYQDNYGLRDGDFTVTDPAEALGEDSQPVGGPTAGPKGATGKKPPAKGAGKTGAGAKAAIAHIAFSRGKRFTANQEDIEEEADATLANAGQPLDPEVVRAAVLAASSPEDLAERLMTIVGDSVSQEQFQETLERALFAADVLGYTHAAKP